MPDENEILPESHEPEPGSDEAIWRTQDAPAEVQAGTADAAPADLDPDFIPEPAALSKADETIDAWFVQHFHNLGARLEVDLFNAFHAAKEELKALIAKL